MLVDVLSSLLFFAVSYAIISFQFRGYNKKGKWTGALLAVVAVFAIKLGHDQQYVSQSHYNILEINRHSTTLDIRRSYKRLSKVYHPDKLEEGMQDLFQSIKESYDVLMDEGMRDIYNRFGGDDLHFDPRKDEIKLISDIAVVYLFWAVMGYIMTIPAGSRSCRTWLMIIGVVILAIEVAFKLTDTQMPEWMPERMTEYELVYYLHASLPLMIASLRILSESLYVDVDQTSLLVLKEIFLHQKNLSEQVQELQRLVEVQQEVSEAPSQDAIPYEERQLGDIQSKLVSLRDQMETSNETTAGYIETLKKSSSNPGSGYYWIVFVVLYGSLYFLQ